MKRILTLIVLGTLLLTSSCESFFKSETDRLLYSEDYTQTAANDSVYSLLGILTHLQKVADRHVLLGELRADLVQPNLLTGGDLRDVANYTVSSGNRLNNIRDYYAIINGCNAYLAGLDTTHHSYVREYTAAKAIRAWTYLQIGIHYGKASFYTNPIYTSIDSQREYPSLTLHELCPLLIADLEPLREIGNPTTGTIFTMDSRYFYLPVKIVLGDLYLWNGEYLKAAESYYDYIMSGKLVLNKSYCATYHDATFRSWADGWSSAWSTILPDENLCHTPMALAASDGLTSELDSIFHGNQLSGWQVEASASYIKLNEAQDYYLAEAGAHTSGDLRLRAAVRSSWYGLVMTDTLCIEKNLNKGTNYTTIDLYRTPLVYLRFAEACNLAGYPTFAYTLLKYGLTAKEIASHVDSTELLSARRFMDFSDEAFNENGALHGRGCGDVALNDRYELPSADSLEIDLVNVVDLLILEELALETAFEGNRFGDLVRFAARRNQPHFLAYRIATRTGELDMELYTRLLDEKNWYLPTE